MVRGKQAEFEGGCGCCPDCNKLGDMHLAGLIAAGLLATMGTAASPGQSAGSTPRKDAAEVPSLELVSIHKTKDAKPSPEIHDDADGLTAESASLCSLIAEAYGFSIIRLSDQQLIGAPGWAKTELFDVRAKVDSSNVEKLKALKKAETMMVFAHEMTTRTPTLEMVMLQRLLEDRFNLKVHYEQRVMSVFEMTVAKGGVRMKPAHPADPEHGSAEMSNGKLKGDNVPMSFIALFLPLESDIGRPVADKTDATGNYDFELHWSAMGDSKDNGTAESAPSIFTAIQEQMGLKLNSSKEPVWVVVVDHAEMPSEN
jgi:uncharacterized protein (TIGR03435 family)